MARSIHLSHVRGIGPLPDLLEARAGSKAVAKVFGLEGLPLGLLSDKDHRIPLHSVVRLFDRAARVSRDPLLGLETGLAMSPGDYGVWVRFAMQAPTLHGALMRLSKTLPLHQTGSRLELIPRDRDHVVWRYGQKIVLGAEARQHCDHIIPVMIRVVRAYCGPAWCPSWIESSGSSPKSDQVREDVLCASSRPCALGAGIAIPSKALLQRLPLSLAKARPPVSLPDVMADVQARDAETPVDRIEAILALRLMDGKTDIDGAARMANLGRRTLQREIEQSGLTYRTLLDKVRMNRAAGLIRETNQPLADIAHIVGYSDPAHFTRAFRRHFDIPPSHLRKLEGQRAAG